MMKKILNEWGKFLKVNLRVLVNGEKSILTVIIATRHRNQPKCSPLIDRAGSLNTASKT